MKKIIYSLSAGFLLMFSSCQDIMDEKHENPDGFTSTKIEYLFAQGAIKTVEADYADWYNYTFRTLATYTQTAGRREGSNRTNVYRITSDLSRWNNYYVTRMSPLTEVDLIYGSLSEKEKSDYQPYVEAGKVLKAFNTAIATDFFGNMPYSEAFTARSPLYSPTAVTNFKPKYDLQKDIYYAIIEDLKSAAAYFKTATLNSSEPQSVFPRQDVIYAGNTQRWYKFANSLLVRYAMRISNVDEAKAKSVLSGITLQDVIVDNADNAYLKAGTSSTNVGASQGIWRAFVESHNKTNGYYAYAPELMVNFLRTANDPRMQVLFQPASDDNGIVGTVSNGYVGDTIIAYPTSADVAITTVTTLGADKIMKRYGVYNATTFRNNYYLPIGVAITAAEVHFLLAEAASRGMFNGATAEALYNKGIVLSVQNYYDYYKNSTSTATRVPAVLARDITEANLLSWINGSSFRYNSAKAIEQIATQKWIHLNILQPYENWAEFRRTDYPVLLEDREGGNLLNKENTPLRLLLPSDEASMNTDNYNSQSAYNNTNVRLWWDIK
ncbi:MAG: SusD/RagB family nutrient-binding outer membrane lipoprotein [Macellibacteroides fermentans]|uniref:SusD/RagB family nutrient-binding outer membrane lipoprotein n=1 Tax=Macellibacteroides fermentans TaxID=879969 RepID=UPI003ACFB3B8